MLALAFFLASLAGLVYLASRVVRLEETLMASVSVLLLAAGEEDRTGTPGMAGTEPDLMLIRRFTLVAYRRRTTTDQDAARLTLDFEGDVTDRDLKEACWDALGYRPARVVVVDAETLRGEMSTVGAIQWP
jgi:hypothetical protein